MTDTYRVRVGNRAQRRGPSDPVPNETTAKSYVGTFFEDVASAVLNAEEWPQGAGFIGETGSHEPDLLLRDCAGIAEVKAARRSFKFHVDAAQLHAYEAAAASRAGPIPHPTVSYVFVSYQVKWKLAKYKRLGDLIDALAGGVEYLAVLDVAAVRAIGDRFGCSKGYTTPLSDMLGKWEQNYRVTPTRIRPFVEDPASALAEYGLTGWTVDTVSAVEVDVSAAWPGAIVKPFPFVRVAPPRMASRWDGPIVGASAPLFDVQW